MMAVRDEYGVGILMSNDTDLRPALEEMMNQVPNRRSRCTGTPAGLSTIPASPYRIGAAKATALPLDRL